MGSILADYEKAARSVGAFERQSHFARRWFYNVVSKLAINRNRLLSDSRTRARTEFLRGRMYAFVYDPKTKKTLPYYDRFPLAILIEPALDRKTGQANGFYGLNMHYLAPKTRALFLDTLMEYTTTRELDERTRFTLTYQLLKKAAKFREFKPCFKHYLPEHVISQMVEIKAPDWITACYLPVDHFAKRGRYYVWADSMRKING